MALDMQTPQKPKAAPTGALSVPKTMAELPLSGSLSLAWLCVQNQTQLGYNYKQTIQLFTTEIIRYKVKVPTTRQASGRVL